MAFGPSDEDGDGYRDIPAAFPARAVAPAVDPPRVRTDDPVERSRRMTELVGNMWERLFARAGGRRWAPPRVDFFEGSDAKVCGSRAGDAVGVYCPQDRRIHYDVTAAAITPEREWFLVVAHEVGHHVQELRGTFEETGTRVLDRPIDASPLHLREELQAECYAGIWAYAASMGDPDPGFFFRVGYRPGRAKQTRRWFDRGRSTGRPGVCDTFSPEDA